MPNDTASQSTPELLIDTAHFRLWHYRTNRTLADVLEAGIAFEMDDGDLILIKARDGGKLVKAKGMAHA